jgi:hypothetical protein
VDLHATMEGEEVPVERPAAKMEHTANATDRGGPRTIRAGIRHRARTETVFTYGQPTDAPASNIDHQGRADRPTMTVVIERVSR